MIEIDTAAAVERLKRRLELSRILMLVASLSLVALIAIPTRQDTDPFRNDGGPSQRQPSSGSETVRSYLLRYRRAILPYDQERIINEMRPHKLRFAEEMNRVLQVTDHPLLREAILISRSLGIDSAKPHLLGLAARGPEHLSLLAFRAGEQIAPSSSKALGSVLVPNRPTLVIEVLQTMLPRSEHPVDAILPLLGHPNKAVREAALACMPAELSPEQILALKLRVDESDDETRPTALRALSRIKVTARVREWCLECLRGDHAEVRLAALEVLLASNSPPKDLDPIWGRLEKPGSPALERVFCLQLLERSGDFPRQRMRALLPSLSPWESYFAARALIATGDRKGIGILLDLLERRPTLDEASELKLRELVSGLLVEVSGLPLSAGISRWSRWYEMRQRIAPTLLAPIELDVRAFVGSR